MKPGHPVIDVLDFISRGAEQSGETPLSAFSRISDLLPAQVLPSDDADSAKADGLVRWSVRGERTQHGKRYLHLEVSARPILICQRCMRPFVYEVDSAVPLEVVTSQVAWTTTSRATIRIWKARTGFWPRPVSRCWNW
ncbi:hypothetical protein TKWG_09830 [Advenella kashmirensis WT001]|uniref:Large ribosomal RNA subunit accumulation protein YceD n=1 Tax=Advenella kashmirensis (strain DSM 17095 / LMG 22695 / WT001) TaxID=1036672 RepID=I3UB72_ADVKW|nr:hypothetical protein [Advenella kashmirensis]AFK62260.1 hypothetical protein TKWG_09830 [Advenella kashmirensis WT001]